MFLVSFVLILYFDWLLGPHKGQNLKKKKKIKNLVLRSNRRYLNSIFAEMFIE